MSVRTIHYDIVTKMSDSENQKVGTGISHNTHPTKDLAMIKIIRDHQNTVNVPCLTRDINVPVNDQLLFVGYGTTIGQDFDQRKESLGRKQSMYFTLDDCDKLKMAPKGDDAICLNGNMTCAGDSGGGLFTTINDRSGIL